MHRYNELFYNLLEATNIHLIEKFRLNLAFKTSAIFKKIHRPLNFYIFCTTLVF